MCSIAVAIRSYMPIWANMGRTNELPAGMVVCTSTKALRRKASSSVNFFWLQRHRIPKDVTIAGMRKIAVCSLYTSHEDISIAKMIERHARRKSNRWSASHNQSKRNRVGFWTSRFLIRFFQRARWIQCHTARTFGLHIHKGWPA
jgi:hypothetical protein